MNAEEIEEEIRQKVESENSEEVVTSIYENNEEQKDELENNFDEFLKSKTEHSVNEEEEIKKEDKDLFSDGNSVADINKFKLQMFMSLFFTLLDGIHVFIYRMISKYQIEKADIALEEGDKQGLEIYFKTQRVMDFINRLPSEIIGLVHIEYVYYQRFSEFETKMQLAEGANPDVDNEDDNDPDEQEETKNVSDEEKLIRLHALIDKIKNKKFPVKKEAPVKRGPYKKKRRRKAPAKKAVKENE